MRTVLSTTDLNDYRLFLRAKRLPQYRFCGNTLVVPDEYAEQLRGVALKQNKQLRYRPSDFLFDYQKDISAIAIRKRKFALFIDCGLGKTLIYAEFIKHVRRILPKGKAILWISPLMVIPQSIYELSRWYDGNMVPKQIRAAQLGNWLEHGGRFGITNFEALSDDLPRDRIGCIIVDESSMLKSHYGKWGRAILRLGKGVEWKLCGTGTPAPNDRIEYANHAVFLDANPNVNAFLARFFVNKAQTSERWILKPHAVGPFYRSLSHWSIFLVNPAVYGWNNHADDIPPIHVHIHTIPMTAEQHTAVRRLTGKLIPVGVGGIGMRAKLGQLAKGKYRGKPILTNKPPYIRSLIDSWPDESTIVWCIYNDEQTLMEQTFPEAVSIRGETPYEKRQTLIDRFISGKARVLITKPKILGFGLNLQIATRQVFSGLQDSYEQYYQAVKRSNRVGSTRPLNVHIPITDAERPMVINVLRKAKRVQKDADEQEAVFKQHIGVSYAANFHKLPESA